MSLPLLANRSIERARRADSTKPVSTCAPWQRNNRCGAVRHIWGNDAANAAGFLIARSPCPEGTVFSRVSDAACVIALIVAVLDPNLGSRVTYRLSTFGAIKSRLPAPFS